LLELGHEVSIVGHQDGFKIPIDYPIKKNGIVVFKKIKVGIHFVWF
jgi:hypothetical protein